MRYIAFILLFFSYLFASNATQLLTQEEKQWLKQNPLIKIAVMDYWADDPSGESPHTSLLKLLNQYGHLNLVPAKYDKWSEGFSDASQGEKLHGIMGIVKNDQRDKAYFDFTQPYEYIPTYIVVRANEEHIHTLADLQAKKLYVKENSITHTMLKEYAPTSQLLSLPSIEAMYQALAKSDEANAIVAQYIDKEKLKKYQLKVVKALYNQYGEVSIGIHHNYPLLYSIINKAFSKIPIKELSALHDRQTMLSFTPKEQAWIRANPRVKVALMSFYPTNDQNSNIHTELLSLLSHYSDLEFMPAYFDAWSDGFESARRGDNIHGILNLNWSQEREQRDFHYTKPYKLNPCYLVVRQASQNITSLEDLKDKKVYLKERSITHKVVKSISPSIEVIDIAREDTMVQKLSHSKEADALLTYSINQATLDQYKLKVVQKVFNKYSEASLGVSHRHKPLQSIINKIYAKIPKSQLLAIQNKRYQKSKNQYSITLSEQEKAWLRANPMIKIAFMNYWSSDDQGNNIHSDLLKMLNQYSGLNFVSTRYDVWEDGFEDTKKGNTIHGIMNLSWSQEREAKAFYYTKAYNFIPNYLVVRQNETKIKSLKDLKEKTIYLKAKEISLETIKNLPFDVNVINLPDDSTMMKALSRYKKADAFLSHSIDPQKLTLYKLKVAKKIYDRYGEVAIGVSHKHQPLQSIINKIYAKIPKEKLTQLRTKLYKTDQEVHSIKLSQAQKLWIEEHGASIKMCINPNAMPFEKIDKQGKYIGIGAEYIQLFEKRLGYPIKLVKTASWGESLAKIKTKKCDILPIAMQTPKRNQYLRFTTPYLSFPFVIATNKTQLYIDNIEEILDKPLGIVQDYAYMELLQQKYPTINLIEVKSVKEGLQKVAKGELFALLDAVAPIAYEIQHSNLSDLKISGRTGEQWEWSVAVRKDAPLLLAVFEKLLAGINPQEAKEITSKWLAVKFEHGFDYHLFWKILAVLALIIAIFVSKNRKLSAEIAHRKKIQAQLKIQKDRAQAATQAKSMFLARMSHEIRTPMNAVLGMLYLTNKTSLSPIQANYIEKADNAANSLLHVINDILDFSKIEAGKLDIELIEFDFHEMMSKVGSIMSFKAQEKGLELLIKYDPNIPQYLISDAIRIEQILINLIGNALKFTPTGEVIVSPRILSQEEDQCMIEFCIKDSGIGIAPHDQKQLFREFSQVDESMTRRFGGSGLGLVISQKLSRLLGGDIWLESSYKDQGSCFCFSVSLKKATTLPTHKAILPDHLKELKILIVDDNLLACQILKEMLNSFGMETKILHSGEEAFINIVQQQHHYDIVFMDYKMPGINGLECYRRIHAQLGDQTPKTILITAYAKGDVIDNLHEMGIESILSKPIHPSLLFNSILHTIDKEKLINKNQYEHRKELSLISIHGAKVLLVEDNAINQEFATMLLEGQGIVIEIANDGLEALEKIKTKHYDMVLMDIEMPNMDGLEATQRIRAKQEEYYQKVPIVALSAHAMKGHYEKSLKAGMNDHITKPINPNRLFETMLQYIQTKNTHVNLNKTPTKLFVDTQNEWIDFKSGIERVGGNEVGYMKVLKRVANKYRDCVEVIEELVADTKLELAEAKMHELKGVSGNIGAIKLFTLVQTIDNGLKSFIPPNQEQLRELKIVLDATCKCIDELHFHEPTEPYKIFDQESVLKILDTISANLEVNIIQSEEALEKLKPYLQESIYEREIHTIVEQIENFDTDLAMKSIAKLQHMIQKPPSE